MAKIGVSGPWVAKYNNINGIVSYTDGVKLAKMTEFEAAPDDAGGQNNFFADNGIAESDSGSSGSGTITESVDNFSQEGSKLILGIKEETVTVDGSPVKELVFDDDAAPGYFGHGIVVKKRKNGKDLWRAVVHTKVMYSVPSDAATTQGESIEWQAEELSAKYMRDDTAKRRWKREATLNTEQDAIAYVEHVLNIQGLGQLTVTSIAGATTGDTKISVSPALIPGNSYKYVVAPAVGMPSFDEVIGDGYTVWNGTDDITAATGMEILVVEVDASNKAKKAGSTTITANEGV